MGSTEQDVPVERVDEEPQAVTPERGRRLPGFRALGSDEPSPGRRTSSRRS